MRCKSTFIVRLLVLILGLSVRLPMMADDPDKKETIIDKIEQNSEGNIEIIIPDAIKDQIVIVPNQNNKLSDGKKTVGTGKTGPTVKTSGFRIQVFGDGRDPATLESRARARARAIAARFPKYRAEVYVFSSSPNWYTRVGNFKSRDEAWNAMTELKRAFPSFAADMRVVKSPIVTVTE